MMTDFARGEQRNWEKLLSSGHALHMHPLLGILNRVVIRKPTHGDMGSTFDTWESFWEEDVNDVNVLDDRPDPHRGGE